MTTQLDRLARRIANLERTLRDVSGTPQLAHSSIVDGAIDQVQMVDTGQVDEYGSPIFEERLVARYGAQGDGGNTVVTFDDPTPPPPTQPGVTPGPGFMVVTWDGHLDGWDSDVLPSYVRAIGVYAGTAGQVIPSAGTLRAELPANAGGTEVTIGSLDPGEYFVSLCAISQSGRLSEPAPHRLGGPGTSASTVLIEEAIARADAAAASAVVARNLAAEAEVRAAEARAVADAVSAAANRVDAKAVDALRAGDVSLLAADGKTRVTYSRNPPTGAAGELGDTWFQVGEDGVLAGFWECTVGDGAVPVVPEPTEVVPPAPTFTNRPGTTRDEFTVPAAAGVAYLVDSVPRAPGTYTDKEGPVAVAATALPGFRFAAAARVVWAGTLATDGTGYRDPVSVTGEPVFTDADGPDNDTVTLYGFTPADGATWTVNGATKPVGVHPASGTVTVVAVPGEFHTFGTAPTAWSHTFDPLRHVTPPAPTFTDRSGTTQDTYTVPAVTGVEYRTGVTVRLAGTYPGSGAVTVVAYPTVGYALDGVTSWSHEFSDVVTPATEVTPAAPTFTDPPGVEQDAYTVPTSTGVTYQVGGAVKPAGTHPGSGTVTVVAVPGEGYAVAGTSSWSHTFSTARTPVAATPPGFTDVDGAASDTYTIPTKTGAVYQVAGATKTAGTYSGSGTVTVVAVPAGDAYTLTGTTSWSFTFDPTSYVTPPAPTFTDLPGTAQDTVTIPTATGVVYRVGGDTQPGGAQPASGTVTVTAHPTAGYAFTQGATASWAHTFTATRTTVTPAAPTFTDVDGTAQDTVTVPNVTGVTYTVAGQARTPGVYPAAGAVTVTAAAATDGYQLAAGSPTTWSHTFDPLFYVTPTGPTWNDTADTYTIPAQTGVDYSVDGQTKPAGTYTVPVGAVLASTNFTGLADQAAWPAPWTRSWGQGTNSKTFVQTQKGIIQAGGLANWSSKHNVVADMNVADVDITYTLTLGAAGGEATFHHLMARIPANVAPQPSAGYDLIVRDTGLFLYRVTGWAGTVLGQTTALTVTPGTAYKVRFQLQGIGLRGKLWLASGAEPAGWGIDTTDTVYATGYVGLQVVGGGTTNPYQHTVDDIVLSNPAGGAAVTVVVTAAPKPGYSTAQGATTTWSHVFS